jgi:hypothetical protein
VEEAVGFGWVGSAKGKTVRMARWSGGYPRRFPASVKNELARRAGFRCSRPECRAPTSGPSDTRRTGASSVGVAAHITAAAPGGPRYDPSMTPHERQSASNGVWLCQNHAKMIDDDARRFNVSLLQVWRSAAEHAASDEQGRPHPDNRPARRSIVPFERNLPSDREELRTALFEFLTDVGAVAAWGVHADLAYMTLYELALNALIHGAARSLYIGSTEHVVTVHDDGAPFGLPELRSGGRGAHLALKHLEATAAGSITVRHQRTDAGNRWSLVDELGQFGAGAPCSLAVHGSGRAAGYNATRDVSALQDCEEIHIYAPQLWSVSDWAELLQQLTKKLPGRTLVIHGIPHDSHVRSVLGEILRHIRIPDEVSLNIRFPD